LLLWFYGYHGYYGLYGYMVNMVTIVIMLIFDILVIITAIQAIQVKVEVRVIKYWTILEQNLTSVKIWMRINKLEWKLNEKVESWKYEQKLLKRVIKMKGCQSTKYPPLFQKNFKGGGGG
jgi:predicted Holliday junction resolvase-like endonuclease